MNNLCSFWLAITAWKERRAGPLLCFGFVRKRLGEGPLPRSVSHVRACSRKRALSCCHGNRHSQTTFFNPRVPGSAACERVLALREPVQLEETGLSGREQKLDSATAYFKSTLSQTPHVIYEVRANWAGHVPAERRAEKERGRKERRMEQKMVLGCAANKTN